MCVCMYVCMCASVIMMRNIAKEKMTTLPFQSESDAKIILPMPFHAVRAVTRAVAVAAAWMIHIIAAANTRICC